MVSRNTSTKYFNQSILDNTTSLGCYIISQASDIHILQRAVGGECFEKRKSL